MVKQFIIADNQDLTHEGLRSMIARAYPADDIVDVTDREQLVAALERSRMPVVVLDFELFDLADADDLENISLRFPLSHWLLVGNHIDDALVEKLGRDTSVSMVLKSCTREEFAIALQCAGRGDRYLCHQISSQLIRGLHKDSDHALTATEKEILRLIAYGKSVKEIATERNSSVHTIITHKKNIFRKIDVNSTHDATRYALRTGLIDIEYYI